MVLVALFRVFVTIRTSDWSRYKPVDKGKAKEQGTEPSGAVLTAANDAHNGSSSESQTTETENASDPLEREYVYFDSYRSTVVAEIILHLISAVWCPPKLPLQTSIWIAFSLIGHALAR
ncbi:hypothetical protein CGCF413_v005906 [Colletotrichum fructicola]|nr:hypothetical protein CGCF413_v005906 [Colletotrichum fructicola]